MNAFTCVLNIEFTKPGLQRQRGVQVRPKALFKLGLPSIFGSWVDFLGLLLFGLFHFGSTDRQSLDLLKR